MKYTEKVNLEFIEEYKRLRIEYFEKATRYLNANISNDEAKKYLKHGFLRRLRLLMRCVDKIYKTYPPTQQSILDIGDLADVNIMLQAFITNVYGCLDNLAWIFVIEKNIKIRPNQISIYSKELKKYYSDTFLKYLYSDKPNELEIKKWFDTYCKKYRDRAVHRLPLYVPPFQINKHSLEKEHCPFFTDLIDNDYEIFSLHGQILADLNTIMSIADKFFEQFK